MSSPNDEKMTNHEYDGIRELDNDLPLWWLITFLGTIIFAFIYWIHYASGTGPTQTEELAVVMKQIQAQKGTGPSLTEGQLEALFTGETAQKGHEIFSAKCASCHGPEGAGLIGPNLTDAYWINGHGTRTDLFRVIGGGVPQNGMPAWAELMNEGDLVAAAAYVYSIHGKNLPGKPPQGEKVETP